MQTLRVRDILADKILVSRESAHLLEQPLAAMLSALSPAEDEPTPIGVDFEGVEGIAPSFLDELLSVFESVMRMQGAAQQRSLMVIHPPARLSLKFEAVARGHDLSIQALPEGSWSLTHAAASRKVVQRSVED
jgi:hypothetical protein